MTIRKTSIFLFLSILLIGCSLPKKTLSSDPVSIAQRGQSVFTADGSSKIQDGDTEKHPTDTLSPLQNITAQTEDTASGAVSGINKVSSTPSPSDTPKPSNTLAPGVTPSITNTPKPNSATNTNPPQSSNTPKPQATNTIKNTSMPLSTSASTDTSVPPPQNTQTSTFTYTPTHTQPPPATSTNTSAPASCSPSGNSSFENQVVSLINAERAAKGLPALTKQSQLTSAARIHSQDMACNNFFSHTSPTTGSPFDRIAAQGYSYSWAGENIAAGYGSASATVDGWMNSLGHKSIILDPNYVHIGVGYAYWGSSAYGSYITAVFAAP